MLFTIFKQHVVAAALRPTISAKHARISRD